MNLTRQRNLNATMVDIALAAFAIDNNFAR